MPFEISGLDNIQLRVSACWTSKVTVNPRSQSNGLGFWRTGTQRDDEGVVSVCDNSPLTMRGLSTKFTGLIRVSQIRPRLGISKSYAVLRGLKKMQLRDRSI
ncbi:hypothetical protein N7536_001946 [Penicillium majusculum]|nr:hypothetical protein N7536_001946 [Penicillium majusculum]